ncbi:hypothetical protein HHI36_011193 [Cryptolaemus montrouzieri]|uniref:SCP domain-containing protein n=1 Tax=Cryptolaemus montrouzieri TaxID=559131 RepID=A0ABD2ML07_9CUCU
MRFVHSQAIFLIAVCGIIVAGQDDVAVAGEGEDEATTPATDKSPVRMKTKNLMKPSFIPYCVTRDVCKPVCDCAIYEDCEILEMNADVRNRILVALNQARSIQTKGEPQASGMPKLVYEMELEEISKCWSARCEDEYSECFRTPFYTETTQTVGLLPLDIQVSELPLDYWDRTIQIWLGEVRKTNAEVVSSLPAGKRGEDVHSYAQILADRIHKVGCAWSRLVPTGGSSEQPSLIFVCTFAPRGPRQGEAIYKTGKACTTCHDGYQCDNKKPFEFLCKDVNTVVAHPQGKTDDEQHIREDEEKPRGISLDEPEEIASISPKTIPRKANPYKTRTVARSSTFIYGIDRCMVVLLLSLVRCF